ncbi:MAG: succinate dehydrogenase cytochrome b subunit [Bacteroidales bacterium]|nr:succinate dehydrogenase cytochrome b subunit [Bacteroidales bacterium]
MEENNKLIKISSITKKLVVGFLGAFLLLFLLFHMSANLLILRNDGGEWYSAFCHFMGTNIFVKAFEIVLLGCLLLHIVLTIILWFQNRKARGNVRYHQRSRTKTSTGSKLTILTGILILAFLVLHFCNFYFVKMNIVKGTYMVKTEDVQTQDVAVLQQTSQQYGMAPEDFVEQYMQQMETYASQLPQADSDKMRESIGNLKKAVPVVAFLNKAMENDMLSKDGKWIHHIDKEDKAMLEDALQAEVEPDFYYMARDLFKNPIYTLLYLLCFVILWIHLRHAFESVFQTWGLENYKWYPIIKVFSILYAWGICLGFTIVPICVILFL